MLQPQDQSVNLSMSAQYVLSYRERKQLRKEIKQLPLIKPNKNSPSRESILSRSSAKKKEDRQNRWSEITAKEAEADHKEVFDPNMQSLNPNHQGSTFLYYDYKRINPDYINNLRWFLLKNVVVLDRKGFEGTRDFVHSACSTPANSLSTVQQVFNKGPKKSLRNLFTTVSIKQNINERQIKRHFLQSFHSLIIKSQVKYYSHRKYNYRRSRTSHVKNGGKTLRFSKLLQENGPYEQDITPKSSIIGKSLDMQNNDFSEYSLEETMNHNSSQLKKKMSRNVLKGASFKLQMQKSSSQSKKKAQSTFNLKQFLQFEKMSTKKVLMEEISPLEPKNTQVNMKTFQALNRKERPSNQKISQMSFLKKKLVSFRKLPIIKHSTRNNDQYSEIKSAIPFKPEHQISPILVEQDSQMMPLSYCEQISQLPGLDAKRNKYLDNSFSKSSETDPAKKDSKSPTNSKNSVKQARKKLFFKSKTSNPNVNQFINPNDGINTHDNPRQVRFQINDEVKLVTPIPNVNQFSNNPNDEQLRIDKLDKQIELKQKSPESLESESLSSNADICYNPKANQYTNDASMKGQAWITGGNNLNAVIGSDHRFEIENSPLKSTNKQILRQESNVTQHFSSKDLKEIKHNWQKNHKLHILRCMNKEEEQVASLKFLRILGNHLKEPSSNNLVKGFTNAQEMRKIYNEINLNNVVSQLEDNEEDLTSFDRQYLKYNNMYMNYIDSEGSAVNEELKELPQTVNEEQQPSFSESLISDSSYHSNNSQKLKIEMRKMLLDQNSRSSIKHQNEALSNIDDLIIEENNIIEEESVSHSNQLDNSTKTMQRNQPVNVKVPASPLNSIKEDEVYTDSADKKSPTDPSQEEKHQKSDTSESPEDTKRYQEDMAKLKRQQFMEQKEYEIKSITEAGIEDGSSVMLSEFKTYGKRYFDPNSEKMKLMNKLSLIKSNNSMDLKPDSAKSGRQEQNTAIRDILLRESKIKDTMTPQECSQNRFQQDLLYQPIYVNDTEGSLQSPTISNNLTAGEFVRPQKIQNTERTSNQDSASEQVLGPTMQKVNLIHNPIDDSDKKNLELGKLSKSSSGSSSHQDSKAANDDVLNQSKSNSSSIQSLCEESDVSGLYKDEMARVMQQQITQDQPKRVLANDSMYITLKFKDEDSDLEILRDDRHQALTPKNEEDGQILQQSYNNFKYYNNTINNMSNVRSNFKVNSKISSMNLFGASSNTRSLGNGSIKLHGLDDNSLRHQFNDDIEEEEKVASSDEPLMERLNSFDTENYNIKSILSNKQNLNSAQVSPMNKDLFKNELTIKNNSIQNSQRNLFKYVNVNKGSEKSLHVSQIESPTHSSFQKIQPLLCKLVGPNSESASKVMSDRNDQNYDQDVFKFALNEQIQVSQSSNSETQHSFALEDRQINLQKMAQTKLSIDPQPLKQEQLDFYEKSPTTIIEDLHLHEDSHSPDSISIQRQLRSQERQEEQADVPIQSSLLIPPLSPESSNQQTGQHDEGLIPNLSPHTTFMQQDAQTNHDAQTYLNTVQSFSHVQEEEKLQTQTMDNPNRQQRGFVRRQSSSIKHTQLVVSDRSYNYMIGDSMHQQNRHDKNMSMPIIEFSSEGQTYERSEAQDIRRNNNIMSQNDSNQSQNQINEQRFNIFQGTQGASQTRNMARFYQNYMSQGNRQNHQSINSSNNFQKESHMSQKMNAVNRHSLLSEQPQSIFNVNKKSSLDIAHQGVQLYQQQTIQPPVNSTQYQNKIYRTVQNSRNVTPRNKEKVNTHSRLIEKRFSQNFLNNFKKQLQDLDTEIDKMSNNSPAYTGVMVSRNNSNLISPTTSVRVNSPAGAMELPNQRGPIRLDLQEVQNSSYMMDNSNKTQGRMLFGDQSHSGVRFNTKNIEDMPVPMSCKNTGFHSRQNSVFSKKSSYMKNQSISTSPQNIQTNLQSPKAASRITKYEQQFNEMMKKNTKKSKKSNQFSVINQYKTMQNSYNNTPTLSPVAKSPKVMDQFNFTMANQKTFKLIDQKQQHMPAHSVKSKQVLYNNFQKQVYPQKQASSNKFKHSKHKSYNTSPSRFNLINNKQMPTYQRNQPEASDIPIQMKFEVSVESLEQFNDNEQSFGRHQTKQTYKQSFLKKPETNSRQNRQSKKSSLTRKDKRNTVMEMTNPEWFVQR